MAESKHKLKNIYVFDSKHHDVSISKLAQSNLKNELSSYKLTYIKDNLEEDKLTLIQGADALIVGIRDKLNSKILTEIAKIGIKLVILMAQNYDGVDIATAKSLGIQIAYCPFYSPEAIAEHATALLMTVNRKIHKAYNRVREDNFELDGLLGVDLHGKTAGILGFGKIGRAMARILIGFGMKVLVWDKLEKNEEKLAVEFGTLDEVLSKSDVVSLHLAINEETKYIINEKNIAKMKDTAFLINTARGRLINSDDLLKALLSGKFLGVGLDVYDDKYEVFFNLQTRMVHKGKCYFIV